MLKIDVLATFQGEPIRTKTALTQLISTSTELVKIVPLNPSPGLVAATNAYNLPAGSVFVAHSPTGRKWSAEISRNESREFRVK
jgi:hypothetical protein